VKPDDGSWFVARNISSNSLFRFIFWLALLLQVLGTSTVAPAKTWGKTTAYDSSFIFVATAFVPSSFLSRYVQPSIDPFQSFIAVPSATIARQCRRNSPCRFMERRNSPRFAFPTRERDSSSQLMDSKPFQLSALKLSSYVSEPDNSFASCYQDFVDDTPLGRIRHVQRFVADDFGMNNIDQWFPSQNDTTSFVWITATVLEQPFTLADYVTYQRYFSLRNKVFPTATIFDYRPYDFRLDDSDTYTVRCTVRLLIQGPRQGILRLRRGSLIPPTNEIQTIECPPEAVSITIDKETGKITRLCTDFVMDATVGNTDGCTNVAAVACSAGYRPYTMYDRYPPAQIYLRRLPTCTTLPKSSSLSPSTFDNTMSQPRIAPFPEQVMIQLAKSFFTARFGLDDSTLLKGGRNAFTFVSPYLGVVMCDRDVFLRKYARRIFGGPGIDDELMDDARTNDGVIIRSIELDLTHFRIDPYEPERIWVDVRPRIPDRRQQQVSPSPGDSTQSKLPDLYEGVPESLSVTFDDDGYCIRFTAGAPIDVTGNAGMLPGREGYKYAMGRPSLAVYTRPLPRILGRIQKRILQPITGFKVDEYRTNDISEEQQNEKQAIPFSQETRMQTTEAFGKSQDVLRAPSKSVVDLPNRDSILSMTKSGRLQEAQEREQTPQLSNTGAYEKENDVVKKLANAVAGATIQIFGDRKPNERSSVSRESKGMPQQRQNREYVQQRQQKQISLTPKKSKEVKSTQKQASLNFKADDEDVLKRIAAAIPRATIQILGTGASSKPLAANGVLSPGALAKKHGAKRTQEEIILRKKALAQQLNASKLRLLRERERETAAKEKKRQQDQYIAMKLKEARKSENMKNGNYKKLESAIPQATIPIFGQENQGKSTQRLLAQKPKNEKVGRAQIAQLTSALPRATIPLFLFDTSTLNSSSRSTQSSEQPSRKTSQPKKLPPNGIPALSRWRTNPDGSLSGIVRGSKSFEEGERITTSPIVKGSVENGQVVTTGSGSRYFLL
jgi:hypothetical protein